MQKQSVFLADGNKIQSEGIGSLIIRCETFTGDKNNIVVSEVRYVPKLDCSLLSVRALINKGFSVHFVGIMCKIMRQNEVVAIATVTAKTHLYRLSCMYTTMQNDCLH